MDWLTFISTVIGVTIWPAALVTVAIIFRGKISGLLDRIREVSGPGGTGAKFGEELEKSQDIADQLPVAENRLVVLEKKEAHDPLADEIERLAETQPALSIMAAYKNVELELQLLARRLGIIAAGDITRPWRISQVFTQAGIGPVEQELFQQVRMTRNAAVHTQEPVSKEEALEFKDLTERLIAIFKSKPEF